MTTFQPESLAGTANSANNGLFVAPVLEGSEAAVEAESGDDDADAEVSLQIRWVLWSCCCHDERTAVVLTC